MDKALLSYHGEPQVRRLAAMMEKVAGPVYVSVRRSQVEEPGFQGLRLLCDQVESIGPLAGLLAAFAHEQDCAWLVAAVDLPEPVCTIYEPAIVPVLEHARKTERYSLMLLRDVPLKLVDPADERELRGVNEPGEFRPAGSYARTSTVRVPFPCCCLASWSRADASALYASEAARVSAGVVSPPA